jgi:hypothetical protein
VLSIINYASRAGNTIKKRMYKVESSPKVLKLTEFAENYLTGSIAIVDIDEVIVIAESIKRPTS